MTDRARPGLSLGTGVVVVVAAAVALPVALLVHERFLLPSASVHGSAPSYSSTPEPQAAPVIDAAPAVADEAAGIDVVGLRAAVAELEQRAAAVDVERAALELRALEGERGERLRLLGRSVARARDARRSAGQAGPQLRGPFPVDELGDLGFLGLGANARWLLGRDGKVLAPGGVTPPVSLATTGRDEDAAAVDATVDGRAVQLKRRCLPNEGYCVVDVETPIAPTPSLDLAPLRQRLAGAATGTTAKVVAPQPTTVTTATTTPLAPPATMPRTPALLVLAGVVAAIGLLLWAVSRLRLLASAINAAALRLRAALAGRPTPAPSTTTAAELSGLDAAIDEACAAAAAVDVDARAAEQRKARLTAVADALAAVRERGGVERVAELADGSDDAVTARLVQSSNALLDALDERGRRWRALVDEAAAGDGGDKVLPSLAQRLMRLARIPGLPQNLADELASLGGAVAALGKPGASQALLALRDEVSRVTPAAAAAGPAGAAERVASVAALRDLPVADVARLTRSVTGSESPTDPPRPLD